MHGWTQHPEAYSSHAWLGRLSVRMRASHNPLTLTRTLRSAVLFATLTLTLHSHPTDLCRRLTEDFDWDEAYCSQVSIHVGSAQSCVARLPICSQVYHHPDPHPSTKRLTIPLSPLTLTLHPHAYLSYGHPLPDPCPLAECGANPSGTEEAQGGCGRASHE